MGKWLRRAAIGLGVVVLAAGVIAAAGVITVIAAPVLAVAAPIAIGVGAVMLAAGATAEVQDRYYNFDTARERIRTAEELRDDAQRRAGDLEAENRGLRGTINANAARLDEVGHLQAQIAVLEENAETFRARIVDAEAAKARAERRAEEAEGRTGELEGELAAQTARADGMEGRAENALRNMKQRWDADKTALRDTKTKLHAAEESLGNIEFNAGLVLKANAERDTARRERDAMRTEMEATKKGKMAKNLKGRVKTLEAEKLAVTERYQGIVDDMRARIGGLEGAGQEVVRLQVKNGELQTALHDAKVTARAAQDRLTAQTTDHAAALKKAKAEGRDEAESDIGAAFRETKTENETLRAEIAALRAQLTAQSGAAPTAAADAATTPREDRRPVSPAAEAAATTTTTASSRMTGPAARGDEALSQSERLKQTLGTRGLSISKQIDKIVDLTPGNEGEKSARRIQLVDEALTKKGETGEHLKTLADRISELEADSRRVGQTTPRQTADRMAAAAKAGNTMRTGHDTQAAAAPDKPEEKPVKGARGS